MSARRQVGDLSGLEEQLAAIRLEARRRYHGEEPEMPPVPPTPTPAEQLAAVRAEAERRYREATRAAVEVLTPEEQLAQIREEAQRRYRGAAHGSQEEPSAAPSRARSPQTQRSDAPRECTGARRREVAVTEVVTRRWLSQGMENVEWSRPPTSTPDRGDTPAFPRQTRAPPGCLNCRRLGHAWKKCTRPLREDFCRRCNRDGTTTENCPGPHGMARAIAQGRADRVQQIRQRNRACVAPLDMTCPRCFTEGHGPQDCTVPWTPNSPPYCTNCYRLNFTRSTCPDCNGRRRRY